MADRRPPRRSTRNVPRPASYKKYAAKGWSGTAKVARPPRIRLFVPAPPKAPPRIRLFVPAPPKVPPPVVAPPPPAPPKAPPPPPPAVPAPAAPAKVDYRDFLKGVYYHREHTRLDFNPREGESIAAILHDAQWSDFTFLDDRHGYEADKLTLPIYCTELIRKSVFTYEYVMMGLPAPQVRPNINRIAIGRQLIYGGYRYMDYAALYNLLVAHFGGGAPTSAAAEAYTNLYGVPHHFPQPRTDCQHIFDADVKRAGANSPPNMVDFAVSVERTNLLMTTDRFELGVRQLVGELEGSAVGPMVRLVHTVGHSESVDPDNMESVEQKPIPLRLGGFNEAQAGWTRVPAWIGQIARKIAAVDIPDGLLRLDANIMLGRRAADRKYQYVWERCLFQRLLTVSIQLQGVYQNLINPTPKDGLRTTNIGRPIFYMIPADVILCRGLANVQVPMRQVVDPLTGEFEEVPDDRVVEDGDDTPQYFRWHYQAEPVINALSVLLFHEFMRDFLLHELRITTIKGVLSEGSDSQEASALRWALYQLKAFITIGNSLTVTDAERENLLFWPDDDPNSIDGQPSKSIGLFGVVPYSGFNATRLISVRDREVDGDEEEFDITALGLQAGSRSLYKYYGAVRDPSYEFFYAMWSNEPQFRPIPLEHAWFTRRHDIRGRDNELSQDEWVQNQHAYFFELQQCRLQPILLMLDRIRAIPASGEVAPYNYNPLTGKAIPHISRMEESRRVQRGEVVPLFLRGAPQWRVTDPYNFNKLPWGVVEHVNMPKIAKLGFYQPAAPYRYSKGAITFDYTRTVEETYNSWVGGGCQPLRRQELIPHSLRRLFTFFPQLTSSHNNCLFAAIYDQAKSTVFNAWKMGKETDALYDLLRKQCHIEEGIPINFDGIAQVVKTFPLEVEVYTLKKDPPDQIGSMYVGLEATFRHPVAVAQVRVLLHCGHYYPLPDTRALKFRRCGVCYKWMSLTATFTAHLRNCKRCANCSSPYTNPATHKCHAKIVNDVGERTVVKPYALPEQYTGESSMYWGDFETSTFGVSIDQHTVYAASFMGSPDTNYGKEPVVFYGLGSLEKFMIHISALNGTMVFYNGSAFDFVLIFHFLLHRGAGVFSRDVKDVVLKDNRIMSFQYKKLRFIDLYLFLRCSLDKACHDLKVPEQYCKSKFDHQKMSDFAALNKYEQEVTTYLKLDVQALRCCWTIFAKDCWQNFHVNVGDFMTLSQMAYNVWTSTLPAKVQLYVPKPDEDNWFRRALFGGRCGPQVPSYYSTEAQGILETLAKRAAAGVEPALTDDEFKTMRDCGVNVDVVSLYPFTMHSHTYPCGRFSIHEGVDGAPTTAYALKRLKAGDTSKGGFYEVDLKCPRTLLTAFLQERGGRGELIYSLEDKKHQVYTGVELREAMHLGYEVTKLHRYASFPSMCDLFKPFIDKCFAIKKASAKGSVSYLTAKLFMNAVSGKQSQKVITTDHKFVTSNDELVEVLSKSNVSDVRLLYASENSQSVDFGELGTASASTSSDGGFPSPSVVGALVKSERKRPLPTKCVYLGAWILGAARVWMSKINRMIGGYSMPSNMFWYHDTDSYIFGLNTYEILCKQNGVVGKDLGMLADELEGGRIIRAVFLAPKSYIVEYISGRSPHRLKWKVRCKGFPHDEGEIDVCDVMAGKYAGYHQMVYELYDIPSDGKTPNLLMTNKCITFEMFERMLADEGRVVVQIDSLKRALCDISYRRGVGIFNVEIHRTMNKVNWWRQNKRTPITTTVTNNTTTTTTTQITPPVYSVPDGHVSAVSEEPNTDMAALLAALGDDIPMSPIEFPAPSPPNTGAIGSNCDSADVSDDVDLTSRNEQ